jgi:hypothetical protein
MLPAAMRLTARERWPSVAGLVFVVLLVPAFIIGTAPEAETSDETILDYYTDSGNQAKQVVAAVILAVAVISFLVFVSGLRQLLVDARVSGALRDLTLAGGLAFAIMALTGISIGTAVPATFVFSDTFELDPDTARVVLTMGNIGFSASPGSRGRSWSQPSRSPRVRSICSRIGSRGLASSPPRRWS